MHLGGISGSVLPQITAFRDEDFFVFVLGLHSPIREKNYDEFKILKRDLFFWSLLLNLWARIEILTTDIRQNCTPTGGNLPKHTRRNLE